MASGLPGARGGTPLTRLVSPTLNQANRDTACPDTSVGGYPRPEGFSCDEYPFASPVNGAYTSGQDGTPHPGPTFNWCQINTLPTGSGANGWSACMIPGPENSLGGSRLGGFYQSYRVIDGDDFWVLIVA
ncbi:NucA/NucB deoxyribonuclease domain-containing protein [Streptomyces profundus]|uniref:NucA/NucB deoxyribonuclease domain-containing protein n=1 Tax=Streptomyces profundus TaxID=2867410 RepID=UPI003CC8A8D8